MVEQRAVATENLRAVDGRLPGRRGRATRQRLLDETESLLGHVSIRDLKVVDISRAAGTSPATFYQYFADVDGAVLSLAEAMVISGAEELRALVSEPAWDGPGAARGLASGFLAYFDRHAAMLRVIDLASTEGDERFRSLRLRLLNGVFLALRELADEAGAAGRLAVGVDPGAAAAILTTMLAHVSAHQPGFAAWGVEGAELAETMATLIDWTFRPTQSGDTSHPE
jgi:AcrR family transcriptional regulator